MRHQGSIHRRSNRAARPGCEALEGRALLAASALDPTFGQRGVALGPVAPQSGAAYITINSASALQDDGKVVVVTQYDAANDLGLAVERRNADGTPDATFGVGGTAIVPLPAGSGSFGNTNPGVAVGPDGTIVLAVGLAKDNPTMQGDFNANRSVIVRLTPGGQLDTTFARDGEFLVDLPAASFRHVAVQPDGKIVAAGTTGVYSSTSPDDNKLQVAVIRLTDAGAYDTTFGDAGTLDIIPPTINTFAYDYVKGLALAPDGQIVVASELSNPLFADSSGSPFSGRATVLSRVNADGTPDATFGNSGSLDVSNRVIFATGLAVQPDSKIVLGGLVRTDTLNVVSGLARFLPDGQVDPSFTTTNLVSPAGRASDQITTFALAPDGTFTLAGTAFVPGIRGYYGLSTSGVRQFVVQRLRADGTPDAAFGTGGRSAFYAAPTPIAGARQAYNAVSSVAVTPAGQVVLTGRLSIQSLAADGNGFGLAGDQLVLARVNPTSTRATAGDYDGDGKADVAAQLADLAIFAVRPSAGGADRYDAFGPGGIAEALPLTGDYDGDGKADVAAYLPTYGVLAYRPSGGGPDVLTRFGSAGLNASIPVAGDFDGDGKTDIAVYLPAYGGFAVQPSGGGGNYLVPFGKPGQGLTIPAVGDYDGDGRTDFAAYLPETGQFAIRPSAGGSDTFVDFGSAGFDASIPAPADYDGDGQTDIAVYLPAFGSFAVQPTSGANYLVPLGEPDFLRTVPAVLDYDGDGKADPGVYLPLQAQFAYRSSASGTVVNQGFGAPGSGETLPAGASYDKLRAVPAGPPIPVVAASFGAPDVALTDDVLATLAGTTAAKKKA